MVPRNLFLTCVLPQTTHSASTFMNSPGEFILLFYPFVSTFVTTNVQNFLFELVYPLIQDNVSRISHPGVIATFVAYHYTTLPKPEVNGVVY